MADMMAFPDTVEEFMEQYKIVETNAKTSNVLRRKTQKRRRLANE